MNRLFTLLLLTGISTIFCSQLEAQTLTVGEVFDYDVGDEFHSRHDHVSGSVVVTRVTIMDKNFSVGKDTVVYTLANNGYIQHPDSIEPFIDTFDLQYTDLNSSIYEELNHWGKRLRYLQAPIKHDSIILKDPDLCHSQINGLEVSNNDFLEDKIYAKGLGLVKHESGRINGSDKSILQMFYYKKGTETCGKPDLKSSVSRTQPQLEIQVFPNPASETLYITSTNNSHEPVTVEVLSLKGETLMKTILQTPTTKLSIQHLPAGTYLVRSKTSQLAHTELILKQ